MASRKVRPIHHQMLRVHWVEDEALRKAGLREADVNKPRESVTWVNPEYEIGPSKENLDYLRKKYSDE